MATRFMAPRLVLGRATKTGHLDIPASLADGTVVWDDVQDWSDGITREYRVLGTARLMLTRRGPTAIRADGTMVCLATVEVPSAALDGSNVVFDKFVAAMKKAGVIGAVFDPLAGDSGVTFPTVDTDATEAGRIVRALLADRKRRADALAADAVKGA